MAKKHARLPQPVLAEMAKFGLTVVSVRASSHLVYKLKDKHGNTGNMVLGKTPSDYRAIKNAVCTVKKVATQIAARAA